MKRLNSPTSFDIILSWFYCYCCVSLDVVVSAEGTPFVIDYNLTEGISKALNELRTLTEPEASNMQYLTWNKELANAAGKYATKCQLSPNKQKFRDVRTFNRVGEIWAMANTKEIRFDVPIGDKWFTLQDFYDYETNTCSYPTGCSAYTQLMHANVTQVGCGAATCPNLPSVDFNGTKIPARVYFCYFNDELKRGARPFLAGDFCSKCRSEQICFHNLCKDRSTGENLKYSTSLILLFTLHILL